MKSLGRNKSRSPLVGLPKPADAKVFGYARVSTQDQKLDLQLDALHRFGVPRENIYVEKISGGSAKRPQFERMIRELRPGDTVVVWKMDRMGRRTLGLLQRMAWFRENDIEFKSLTEPLDFNTPMGRFITVVNAASAQMEVELTAERTRNGIAATRGRGNPYGRQTEFDLPAAIKHLRKHGSLTEAAKHVGVTLQRLRYHVQKSNELMKLVKTKK
jgi:DNA invertase Pin-like site-specific DNA recombinase